MESTRLEISSPSPSASLLAASGSTSSRQLATSLKLTVFSGSGADAEGADLTSTSRICRQLCQAAANSASFLGTEGSWAWEDSAAEDGTSGVGMLLETASTPPADAAAANAACGCMVSETWPGNLSASLSSFLGFSSGSFSCSCESFCAESISCGAVLVSISFSFSWGFSSDPLLSSVAAIYEAGEDSQSAPVELLRGASGAVCSNLSSVLRP